MCVEVIIPTEAQVGKLQAETNRSKLRARCKQGPYTREALRGKGDSHTGHFLGKKGSLGEKPEQ